MKTKKLYKKILLLPTTIGTFFLFAALLLLTSCSNNNTDRKTEISKTDTLLPPSVLTPGTDTLKNPILVLSDTCPKPSVIITPTKPGNQTITLKNGKLLKLAPPETKPADFLSIMQIYTAENGLALDAISCAIMDKTGNLWFGTSGGGVSRYDGKSFTNFTTANGLANNGVLSIFQDNMGYLWFGTQGSGVNCYDGKSFTNYTTAQGLANNVVRSIIQDKTGNLWFGTIGAGVSRYDGKSFTNYTTAQGLTNNSVYSITQDKTGNLWFGTDGGGVSRYDGKSFTNYTTANGLASNDVYTIIQDKMGNLWFGTGGEGVSCYDGKSFTNYTTANGLANNDVLIIIEDKAGNLWFGTIGGGVSRYDGKSFTNYTTAQGLPNNIVMSITQDKTGNLWFGTDGGGVCRYEGNSFTNYTTSQGLASNHIYSIIQDKIGNLWFATIGDGVCRFDGKTFTNYTTAQGLAYNRVLCIAQDKTGNLWFGTQGGGVSRYDGCRIDTIENEENITMSEQQDLKKTNGKLVKSFTNFTTAQGLANNDVLSITQDKMGNLWFATYGGGVSRFDGKSFTNFTTAQGLANNFVFCVFHDRTGDLWFGHASGGVSRYDGKSFTDYTSEQGMPNNSVLSITQDKTGNLWFGTDGGGVSRMSKENLNKINKNLNNKNLKLFENYTKEDGLPDNTVTKVLESSDGKIFLGTNIGICELIPSPSAQKDFVVMANYNSSLGYPLKDVNNGAMFEDSKGIIWIGTGSDKTGLVRFDYKALNKNNKPPAILIQAVKINNESICWYNLERRKLEVGSEKLDSIATPANVTEEVTTLGKVLSDAERDSMRLKFGNIKFNGISKFYPLPKHLVLPYEHNHITFEFTAIEPARPYLVKYQYTLEGLDKEWSPSTNKTSAEFGNLWEGTYTFKLKAKSPFGVWSAPIEYKFRVLPPWWRTWWMYIVYVLVFVSIVWSFIKYRERNLKREKEILETKVEQRTEQLQKANVEITEQKKVVEEQKKVVDEKQKEILDSINYAKRIQNAKLPDRKEIQNAFSNSFVLFKPKDIVSGDFYYFHKNEKAVFIASADSTGHGVPGAFMSMIGSEKLDDAVAHSADTSEILSQLNKGIKSALKQSDSNESTRDGMDIALCSVDIGTRIVKYAGANRPIWIIRKDQTTVEEIKATKKAIGGLTEDSQHFDTHEIKLQQGDTFYISTDGYADTFNGKDSKKLTTKKFKELLLSFQDKTMKEQEHFLDKFIEDWKAGTEQVDDILVIGVRL